MVRTYLCATCLLKHPAPTGRNCPKFKKKSFEAEQGEASELEKAFNSPTAKKVDQFLSTSFKLDMNTGDGDDHEGDGTDTIPAAGNSELLQIVKIQQEQMRALHATVAQMNTNIVSLTSKARKVKTKVPDVDTDTDTESESDSSVDERRATIDSPVSTVPEFKSTSKRHKFSLKRYLPRNVTKIVTFSGLVSAFLALVLAVMAAGHSATGMLEHLRFLSDKAASKSYLTESLITYDGEVRTIAETEGLGAFTYGHQSLINKHLGVESTVGLNKKPKAKNQYQASASSNLTSIGEIKEFSICWWWNYRICTNKFCRRQHICYVCYGSNHCQKDCKNRKHQENPSSY